MSTAQPSQRFAEQVMRSAFEQTGGDAEERDFQIERILRLVANSLACRHATFCIVESTNTVHLARTGIEFIEQIENLPLYSKVVRTGEPLFTVDLAFDSGLAMPPMVDFKTNMRSAVVWPVLEGGQRAIGCLAVFSERERHFYTLVARRLLNDGVRLIEDLISARRTAIQDALTGLYNRRYFDTQLASEWRRGKRGHLPLSLLMIDVDEFKAYNDTYGHHDGDRLLARIAGLIQSRIRRAGDVACRFGGEEFAVLLPSTTMRDAEQLAESIRACIENAGMKHAASTSGTITVSVGVGTAEHASQLLESTATELLTTADSALYLAKGGGRNRVVSQLVVESAVT